MALADDLANDYTAFDNVKDCAVLFKPGNVTVAAAKALFGPLSRDAQRLFADLELEVDDRQFTLWVSTIGANELHPQDIITRTDNGSRWRVVGCQLVTLETRYRGVARRIRE